MEGFGGSVAGGGRYDKMIGKFTGMETPACGFSIGFERIVTILLENVLKCRARRIRKHSSFGKGVDSAALAGVIREAWQSAERASRSWLPDE